MRIGVKLGAGFGAILLLLIAIAYSGYGGVGSVSDGKAWRPSEVRRG